MTSLCHGTQAVPVGDGLEESDGFKSCHSSRDCCQNGFGSFHGIVLCSHNMRSHNMRSHNTWIRDCCQNGFVYLSMRSHNNTNIKVTNDTSLAFGIALDTTLHSIIHQFSTGTKQQQ
jgi:hypothetical protein